MEEGGEEGDGSSEGPSAIGERGHAAMSLMPDADGRVPGSFAGFNSIFFLEKKNDSTTSG